MTTRVMIMRMVIKNDDKKGDEVDEENLVESDKNGRELFCDRVGMKVDEKN